MEGATRKSMNCRERRTLISRLNWIVYKNILLEIQFMATELKSRRNSHSKNNNIHSLFQHNHSPLHKNQFVQLFQQFKQQYKHQPSNPVFQHNHSPPYSYPSSQNDLNQLNLNKHGQPEVQDQLSIQTILQDEKKERHCMKQRAWSTNKLEEISRKHASHKGKKTKLTIFQYAKILRKKESDSKKSTDDSNSSQANHLITENQQYRQFLKLESNKLKLMEQTIIEQRKRYELQKFFYTQRINKLNKVVELQTDGQKLKEITQNQESIFDGSYADIQICDTLSIESH